MSKSKKKKQNKAQGTSSESTAKTSKRKVVVTKKEQIEPTKSRSKSSSKELQVETPLLYGRKNFLFILGGIALMGLGMLLMSGGSMPSPDIWDESIIYGFRRITLAPISILLGLALVLYSIFAPANSNV